MESIINIVFVFILSLNTSFFCNENPKKEQSYSHNSIVAVTNPEKVIVPFHKIIDIPLPAGYERVKVKSTSFGNYLRNLPLNTKDNTVYSFDGSIIMDDNYGYQFAVIDMDIGKRDLQQCADAVMRLRAEYLYQQNRYKDIHFNFLSDNKPRYYTNYAKTDRAYPKFRKYMDYIFAYANTASLKKELSKVERLEDIQVGDIFIQSGRPFGHAVIVVDVAINKQNGKKIFMVAQSFMPAQSIHIIQNKDKGLNPWYLANFSKSLVLPSWTFVPDDLRRF